MGGTIAVTLRTPSGEVYRMARSTNSFPGFICSQRFLDSDPEWIAQYLSEWREMAEDYKLNHESGKYKFNMTPAYFPYNLCAPVGYGMVFIDMVNKQIHTHQGYSNIELVYRYHFKPRLVRKASDYLAFAKAGRIKLMRFNPETGDVEPTDLVPSLLPNGMPDWDRGNLDDNVPDQYKEEFADAENWISMFLDLSPYSVTNWCNKPDDNVRDALTQIRDAINALLPLSEEENAAWVEYAKEELG